MKTKFSIEKYGDTIALIAFIFFSVYFIYGGNYGLKNLATSFIFFDVISRNNIFALLMGFIFEILLVLVIISFLFPNDKYLEKILKCKVSVLHKLGLLTIIFSLISPIYTLFTLIFDKTYRIYVYSYDYINAVLQLLVVLVFSPGFLFEKYRKCLFLPEKVDVFLVIIGLQSFFNALLKIVNFDFLSFVFYFSMTIVIFVVLLPFLQLSKYIQEQCKIDKEIKLKLAIILLFLVYGIVTFSTGYQPRYGVSFILIALAIGFTISKWFANCFLSHDFTIIKKLYSITFVLFIIGFCIKVEDSLEKTDKNQTNYYLFKADFSTMQILDNEMLIELIYRLNNLHNNKDINSIKISSAEIQKNFNFVNEHLFAANLNIRNIVEISERQRQLSYDFNYNYKQAYVSLLNAFDDLEKFNKTNKYEYKIDYKIDLIKYYVYYMQLIPIIRELNTLYEVNKNISPLKDILKKTVEKNIKP